jgi:hypothetical protein
VNKPRTAKTVKLKTKNFFKIEADFFFFIN